MKQLLAAAVMSAMVATGAHAETLFYGGDTSYFFENFGFLAISSGSKYIELAGDEVDHRL